MLGMLSVQSHVLGQDRYIKPVATSGGVWYSTRIQGSSSREARSFAFLASFKSVGSLELKCTGQGETLGGDQNLGGNILTRESLSLGVLIKYGGTTPTLEQHLGGFA